MLYHVFMEQGNRVAVISPREIMPGVIIWDPRLEGTFTLLCVSSLNSCCFFFIVFNTLKFLLPIF